MINLNTHSGAIFSEDKKFRYALWRKWKLAGKYIMFIGLNPSRADAVKNDLTITKLVHFAKQWGFDGLYMTNLFSYIEPDSAFIKKIDGTNYQQFIGEHCDEYLSLIHADCTQLVYCWGNFPNISFRSNTIIGKFPGGKCFGKCKSGAPKHPVRLGYATKLELYV